jgi:hypothetical protein
MKKNEDICNIKPILGHEVAYKVFHCIGYFRQLKEAIFITFTLQNYEFIGHGLLSNLLSRQTINKAKITLITTPPPPPEIRGIKLFFEKLDLLENLNHNGIKIFLNEKLHAKVYLFHDNQNVTTTIVGSPNLTTGGFGVWRNPDKGLLELALITNNPKLYKEIMNFIKYRFITKKDTLEFNKWLQLNRVRIAYWKSRRKL